jgi:hypothetical protein
VVRSDPADGNLTAPFGLRRYAGRGRKNASRYIPADDRRAKEKDVSLGTLPELVKDGPFLQPGLERAEGGLDPAE